MSDTVRGTALVLSVLLWSPTAPSLLRGEVPAEKALLLYAAALLLALAGCGLLAALVRAYTPVGGPEPTAPSAVLDPEPTASGRESEPVLS